MLTAGLSAPAPEPMTAADLDEWCASIDARAQADQARGVIRNGVLAAGQAAVDVTNARRARPAYPCPDHPDAVLVPFPGGGARGSCPVDHRLYQMTPPEVTW